MGIKVFDSRKLAQATPLDEKLCNFYVDEDTSYYIIETIAEYLLRITFEYRSASVPVTVLLPKDGMTPPMSYETTEEFDTALANFDTKHYAFIEGLQDANFIEIINNKLVCGILSGLGSSSVAVNFPIPFPSIPVGRKNLHVYRVYTPEPGKDVDENVLFYGLTVTTSGFSFEIDSSESLTGVIIEYLFTHSVAVNIFPVVLE